MTQPAVAKTNRLDAAVRTLRPIKADASGELPTRIMLIKAGSWPDSVKGNLTITVADLHEMKQNFDKGVGRPGGQSIGLPIDFSHNEWDKAAAWINDIVVEGDTLYADPVEWTTAGREAVTGGEYKCVSPSFYPADRGGYADPENLSEITPNVLVGAGLTNIPFFKSLSPVKASSLSEVDEDDNIIYIKQSASAKETKNMSIDELRVKDAASLTADERTFLEANQSELSDGEKTKFGLVTADTTQVTSTIDPADAKILADIKTGAVKVVAATDAVVDAAVLASLQDTAKQYQHDKAAQVVASHVERGAIKSDEAEKWTDRLLKASKEVRADLEEALAAFPANEQIGMELGSDTAGIAASTAREELNSVANAKVEAAIKEGRTLSYADALKAAARERTDLTTLDLKEQGVKN